MLTLAAIVWAVSTFFESWHDWMLHKTLYKHDADWQDKDRVKTLDAVEKFVFVLGFATLWYQQTGDPLTACLFILWQSWARWIGHEFWYAWFSGSPFGSMGTSSRLDLALNYIGLGRWGNIAVMLFPFVTLTLILARE